MIRIAATVLSACLLTGCDIGPEERTASPGTAAPVYRNFSDSAHYVGMQTCRSCHEDIYNSFVRTGMGRSFGVAEPERSAADFSSARVTDTFSGFSYHAYWLHDSMHITEYRMSGRDTVHARTEQVNYIIGSGQHTNSHLKIENGYVTQMPMTYYTQNKRWDLPPGFEGGVNTRFERKIGLECMSCHNGFPEFVKGSENKFTRLPQGIDCERCHGAGSIHVDERQRHPPVDTSRYIDYTIVNPAKLPVDLQFDICQRCHLQGNAIVHEGYSFFDYRPGKKLSDYMSVFMPRYENGDDEFIMASHAERLKMSPCFIKSLKPAAAGALRPYKQSLTCVTCHDPHVSVRETNKQVFNQVCGNCHNQKAKMEEVHRELKSWTDCVKCHMPVSGSTDIPHVTIHDHFIRKPVTAKEKKEIGRFLGLYAVNDKSPSLITRVRAYLDQYEKFKQDRQFLDSAEVLLKKSGNLRTDIRYWIQLNFARGDHNAVIDAVRSVGERTCLEQIFIRPSYDNADAWAAYRTGESYTNTGDVKASLPWLRKAAELAPFNPDFRNKLGAALLGAGDINGAENEFSLILRENPSHSAAYANMGYVQLLRGRAAEARRLLLQGRSLDPDNKPLLLNLATAHLQLGEKAEAIKTLRRVLMLEPSHAKARQALEQLTHE